MFENMTPTENGFLERMKTAPQEQIDHFRNMFNLLMQCYGSERPPGAAVIVFSSEKDETITVHGVNTDPVMMALMLSAGKEAMDLRLAPINGGSEMLQ